MYNYELVLIGGGYDKDDCGNFIPKDDDRTTVLCDRKSVTRTEYYQAAQAGLNPELIFEIKGFEYSGQTEVEFQGEGYSVIRTYSPNYETVELTCERKAKHGKGKN